MKRGMGFLVIWVMMLGAFGFPVEAASPFAGQSSINVVYLGGSITKGAGASNPSKCWASLVTQYFKDKYPDKTINAINAGMGGTGSDMGLLRLDRDVISKNPDVVFVEFAVNDRSLATADRERYMESIVRKLQSLDKVPYIIFLYTTTKDFNSCITEHQNVANYYGIPSINLQSYVKSMVDNQGLDIMSILADGTHPNDAGYSLYADYITQKLETGNFYRKPVAKARKLHPESYEFSPVFTSSQEATVTGSWSNTAQNGVETVTPGDTLTYEFTGPLFAIQSRLNRDGGKYSVTIDGSVVSSGTDCYYNTTDQPVLGFINAHLGNGKHKAVITVLSDKNANSTSNHVSIDYFVTSPLNSLNKGVSEDFERDNLTGIIPNGAAYEWTDQETAGGSAGALHITAAKDANNVSFNLEAKSGQTYKLSVWVKMKNNVPILKEVRFLLQFKEKLSDGSAGIDVLYNEVPVNNVNLSVDNWVKVSATWTCDGKGTKVGTGGQRFDVIDNGTASVRIGDGKLLTTMGSADIPIDYYIDDFSIQPLVISPSNPNILRSGDFESGLDSSAWFFSSGATGGVVSGGANDTQRSLYVSENAPMGCVKQIVPIRFNTSYKITFWAKTDDATYCGLNLQLILDRYAVKQDSSVPNYEYLTDNNNKTLTTQWTKYQILYRNDRITYDTSNPTIYLRIGTGNELVKYYIDEFTIEKQDIVYNGSFDSGMTAWSSMNATATPMETGGANGTPTCMKVQETSNYGSIKQYIYLEPGKKYKISFWAKAESWLNQGTSTHLPIVMVLDRYVKTPTPNDKYTGPNYQYIPDDKFTSMMNTDWTYFEYTYDCNLQTDGGCRMPAMYFRTGNMNGDVRATYYLDEVMIQKIDDGSEPSMPVVRNINMSGQPKVGSTIEFSYTYSSVVPKAGYIYKISRLTGDGYNYISVASSETTEDSVKYKVSAADLGKTLRFEITPVDTSGALGETQTFVTDEITADYIVESSFTTKDWDAETEAITANVRFTNYTSQKNIMAVLALYDRDNVMCGCKVVNTTAGDQTFDISVAALPQAESAKLFVWDADGNVMPYTEAKALFTRPAN